MKVILKPGGVAVISVVATASVFGVVRLLSNSTPAPKASTGGQKPAGVSTSSTAPAPNKPLTGDSVIDPTKQEWTLVTQKPATATMRLTIDPELPPGQQHALHLEVTTVDPNKYWSAQLLKQVPQAVEGNHNLQVRFWGRSKKETSFFLVFEEGVSPHAAELQKRIKLSPEWRQYEFPFRTTKDHTDIHANFCIKAGVQPGEIDIANMHMVDNGPAK